MDWERRDGEPADCYAAFIVYRDMDAATRSQPAVCSETGISRGVAKRWSARWKWVERAAAFDERPAKDELDAVGGGSVQLDRAPADEDGCRLSGADGVSRGWWAAFRERRAAYISETQALLTQPRRGS